MRREGGVYMSASKPQKAEKEHDELSSRFISDSPFLVFIYFFSIVTTLMPKIEVKTNLKLKKNEKKKNEMENKGGGRKKKDQLTISDLIL